MKSEFFIKDWKTGDLNALVKNLGENNARAIAAGTLATEVVDTKLLLKARTQNVSLFNRNGVRIRPRGLKANTTKPDRDYRFNQPTLDYGQRLARLQTYLNSPKYLYNISAADFETRSEAIIASIREDDTVSNLLKGIYLPFVIPQMDVEDYGQILDEVFLTGVNNSYTEQFGGERPFNNYRKGSLAEQTTIVTGSRHERLVEAMKQGTVVGIYFPNCLQGYSVDADREQMESLPEQFLLAGGFDAAAAMIAYPDVLARDGSTPLLDLAAMQWQSSDDSLCFRAYDDDLDFGIRSNLGDASDNYAGGLVVLG